MPGLSPCPRRSTSPADDVALGAEPDRTRWRLEGVGGHARDLEFSAFVAGQSERLLRLALYLTGDRGRAEDLVQTVLERTYLRWARVKDDPLAYVRRSLINANTDWWRRTRSRETLTADDLGAAYVDRDAVVRALAQLTDRERSVVVLRYYEDLSEAQIATALKIAPGTVKSACARALAKLRVAPDLTGMPSNGGAVT